MVAGWATCLRGPWCAPDGPGAGGDAVASLWRHCGTLDMVNLDGAPGAPLVRPRWPRGWCRRCGVAVEYLIWSIWTVALGARKNA